MKCYIKKQENCANPRQLPALSSIPPGPSLHFRYGLFVKFTYSGINSHLQSTIGFSSPHHFLFQRFFDPLGLSASLHSGAPTNSAPVQLRPQVSLQLKPSPFSAKFFEVHFNFSFTRTQEDSTTLNLPSQGLALHVDGPYGLRFLQSYSTGPTPHSFIR